MAALDDCFDRLLGTLERASIAEDTIVVFTSDHGDMMHSQGLTTKLHPWDESIRVPFLVRYPAKLGRRGRRIPTPFNSGPNRSSFSGIASSGLSGHSAFAIWRNAWSNAFDPQQASANSSPPLSRWNRN